MPKIPIYQRTGQLTTQGPNIQRDASSAGAVSGAQAGMFNTVAQAGAKVADTANDLYDQFNKAKNYHEELESDLALINQVNTISDRAAQDPDIEKNLQKYDNELNTGLNESLKGISDPQVRDKALLQGKVKLATVGASLRDLGRKNIISKGQANTMSLVDQYKKMYSEQADPELLKGIDESIEASVKQGFLDAKQGYELKVKSKLDANEKLFAYDMANNRELADKRLNSNFYGFDTEKMEKARAHYERVNHLAGLQETVDTRFVSLNKLANNELNWTNSDDFVNSMAKQDPDLAEAVKKVVDDELDYTPTETDNDAYAEMVKGVFASSTRKELSDFLVKALGADNKQISKDRLAILVNASMQRSNALKVDDTDNTEYNDPKQNEIDGGVKGIFDFMNRTKIKDGNMLTNFLNFVFNGGSSQEGYAKAIKTATDKNPSKIQYKIGQVVTNNRGESAEVIGIKDDGTPQLKRKIIRGK